MMEERTEKLSETEVSSLVREFEKETEIFSLRIGDVSIWQLIRFEVSVQLQQLGLSRAPVNRARIIEGLFVGLKQFFTISPATILCKTFDSAYRRKSGDEFDDIYFDDLVMMLPKLAKITSTDASGYSDNVHNAKIKPVFNDTSIIALSALLGRILPLRWRDPVFDEISNHIVHRFGFSDYTPQRIRRVYNVFWWRALAYKILLRRIGPSALLCADNGQFALMHACRAQNIPFVEMQHGVFTNVHPNALPADLSAAEVKDLLVPDVFAVYGQFSIDVLRNTWLDKHNQLSSVGAPFLEKALAIREQDFQEDEGIRITISTQGIAHEALGAFIKKFLSLSEESFELVVKLHPAYDREQDYYQSIFGSDPRVTIESGSSANGTHAYIARSNLHLSISSTCHYDALGIGTPTGILKLETYESVIELLDQPGAFLVETPEALAKIVRERAFGTVPEATSRYFFETNYPQEVKRVFHTLCPSLQSSSASVNPDD